ncbi:hypothetical protein FrEUN1fDRAFT_0413 [Parafrankia sp. EUN1f]|nr:hypothetical protein FrEUN1fDRAFT_0413 [Parafrankia sp. EUN1f]
MKTVLPQAAPRHIELVVREKGLAADRPPATSTIRRKQPAL